MYINKKCITSRIHIQVHIFSGINYYIQFNQQINVWTELIFLCSFLFANFFFIFQGACCGAAGFRSRLSWGRIQQTRSYCSLQVLIFHLQKPICLLRRKKWIRMLLSQFDSLWALSCVAWFGNPLRIFRRKPLPITIGRIRGWDGALFREVSPHNENTPAKTF